MHSFRNHSLTLIVLLATLGSNLLGSLREKSNTSLILRSLVLLEQQMKEALDPSSRTSFAQQILTVGTPLLGAEMNPAEAATVSRELKAAGDPPAAHQYYSGFWLQRAMATLQADNAQAGKQAAGVLKALGMVQSKKEDVLDIIAALNVKGWLNPGSDPTQATKDTPFVNSLGMKFVPVPGTHVLFCIHETRMTDYTAYARDNEGVNTRWKHPDFEGLPINTGNAYPVVMVSWEDATDFCEWLSKKEGRQYRLPTDREWSIAVGGLENEDPGTLPEDKNCKTRGVYPWGGSFPPRGAVGNFSDAALAKRLRINNDDMRGYADGYATTAPVMSFKPNALGIYDMAGNVLELCQDWMDSSMTERVARSSSFETRTPQGLLSSCRWEQTSEVRTEETGFRCVLMVSESSSGVP